jgi:hypothetical protein
MHDTTPTSEYLVISRGKWDESLPPETIQAAIDRFYEWHGAHVAAGTMKTGSRLTPETKLVTKRGIIDGPFSETKEVVGGFWFITAASLEEAAAMAAENPAIQCGLSLEIRRLDPEKCTALDITAETPASRRGA